MNYDEFRQLAETLLPQCMPEGQVGPGRLRLIQKHAADGASKEGFALAPMYYAAPGMPFSPTYYYSDLYRDFCRDCADDSQIGTWLSSLVYGGYARGAKMATLYYEVCTIPDPGRVFPSLINTDANRDYLKGVPHRELMDLSVIYRYYIGTERGKVGSSVVTHDLAEWLDMAEPQLYEAAVANAPSIFPFRTEWISEVPEFKQGLGYPVDIVLVTDWLEMFGASALLYPDVMHKVSAMLGGDVYIVPSSIHELFAVKANDGITGKFAAEMTEIAAKINENRIHSTEWLSNAVYFYDAKEKTLSLATDSPKLSPSTAMDINRSNAKDTIVKGFQPSKRSPRI